MKKVIVERLTVVLIIVLCAFSSWIFISRAGLFDDNGGVGGPTGEGGDGKAGGGDGIYFFNNAVNTSPEEIGNYWYDNKFTSQAEELPDFSTAQVTIGEEATFDGDIIFNGEAVNNGTVSGNATFIEDISENNGTINGTAIRRYATTNSTGRDFSGSIVWTVVADGTVVDVTSATYDGKTIFSHENGGSFISNMTLVSQTINSNTLTLEYNQDLNSDSIPEAENFDIRVDGEKVDISNITISEKMVIISLSNPVQAKNSILVSYSLGDSLITSTQGLNALPIQEVEVTNQTPTEEVVQDDPVINDTTQMQRGGTTFPFPARPLAIDKGNILEKEKQIKTKEKSTETMDTASSINEKIITSPIVAEPSTEIKSQEKPIASTEIVEKLKTPLLLAVEDKGKIWYVAPISGQRYEVSQSNAINLFRNVALGITNKDLSQIPLANSESKQSKIGNRLEGRFLLQVESRGESWFVQNGFRYRVNSNNLVEITKKSVGGITNQFLEKIPVATK